LSDWRTVLRNGHGGGGEAGGKVGFHNPLSEQRPVGEDAWAVLSCGGEQI
jgi:hypothetical protein